MAPHSAQQQFRLKKKIESKEQKHLNKYESKPAQMPSLFTKTFSFLETYPREEQLQSFELSFKVVIPDWYLSFPAAAAALPAFVAALQT